MKRTSELQANLTAQRLGAVYHGHWPNGKIEFMDLETKGNITAHRCCDLRLKMILHEIAMAEHNKNEVLPH